MNRREENRAERRDRVLNAARKLIAEGGIEALTMRRLAQDAELAVNTLYSLFGGSREDILKAIIEDGIQDLDRILHEKTIDDPLTMAPAIANTVADYLLEHEGVFRPAFLAEAHAVHQGEIGWGDVTALELLREALGGAASEGHLRDDIDLDLLGQHIFQSFRSSGRRWAAREIEGDEFRARAVYAVYVALLAAGTDEVRSALLDSFHAAERELAKARQGRAKGAASGRRH